MKNLLLITIREDIGSLYFEELNEVFGEHLNITRYSFENPEDLQFSSEMLRNTDAIIMPSFSIYNVARNYISNDIPVINLEYTFSWNKIEQLRKYPHDTKAYAGFNFFHISQKAITLLYSLGINNLDLQIYDRDHFNDIDPEDIEIGIVDECSNCFPDTVKNIVSLGRRKLSFITIMDVAMIMSIMDDKLEKKICEYCKDLAQPENCLNYIYDNSTNIQVQFKTVLDCIDDCFVLYNENLTILDCNRQFQDMFGLDDSVTGRDIPDISELGEIYKLTKDIEFIDNMLFAIDNSRKNVMVSKKRIPDRNNRYHMYIMLINDITKIVALENSMRKQLEKKGYVTKYTFDDIVACSDVMGECVIKAKKMAAIDKPTLITGESGTGKEMFAQSIHAESVRRNFPFVAINCAALPANLLESELFGYDEGSFTGARKGGKRGLFELANLGTLFLDEIGELSLDVQAKLLRVLEEKQIMRIGSGEVISVDVRIIAATNRDLQILIKEKKFRLDLFFRLNTIMIKIPSLRERPEDIPLLIQEFANRNRYGIREISSDTMSFLMEYKWYGNIRELRNCTEYMYSISDDVITFRHLPEYMQSGGPFDIGEEDVPETSSSVFESDSIGLDDRNVMINILKALNRKSMGRRGLSEYMREAGIAVSEYKLRILMRLLEENKYICMRKGRNGASLTLKGKNMMESLRGL